MGRLTHMAESLRLLLCALFLTSCGDDASPPPPAYSVEEIVESTIGAGDGSNPNQDGPMGTHDAPLFLPTAWSWAQGATRNEEWGTIGTGNSLYVEWRCSVIPELDHEPSVPFRINVRNAAYWQFAEDEWSKGFDVDLSSGHRGSYLGIPGEINTDPFGAADNGWIEWREEADGSFSAPWNPDALFMHFWAGQRMPALSGQTAELSTAEIRLQQPDGETVDLSDVNVLFQCGLDYYSVTTGEGTKVPGPGIGIYHTATSAWQPTLWVTLPPDAPAASTADFVGWLEAHPPPATRSGSNEFSSAAELVGDGPIELRVEEVDSSVEFVVDTATGIELPPELVDASLSIGSGEFEARIDVCRSALSADADCISRIHIPNTDRVSVDYEARENSVGVVVRDGDRTLLRLDAR